MKKIKKYLLLMFIVFMAFLATFFASPKILDPIFTQQEKIVNIDSLKSKTINKYEAYKSQVSNVNPELVSVDKTKVSGGFMKEIGGVVYVGTSEKGLMRFDKKTKKLVLVNKTNVSDGFIKEIDGVVYVGTYDKGLMRLDEKTKKLVLVDKTNVSGGFIKEIGGVVYVGTTYNGLMKLDEKTKKLVLVNKTKVSYGFMEEIGGVVYVGTEGNGLMRLDKKTKKMVSVDTTNVAAGFIKKIDGVVYVGTTSGLMRLDEKTKKLVLVDRVETSYGFMEEIGGVVYVGTWQKGLMRLDEKTKKLVPVDNTSVSSGFMKEIGGVFYVGTSKGLKRLDFTNVQKANENFLKEFFKNRKIQSQGLASVSDVASRINYDTTYYFWKYARVEIPEKINNYSTFTKIRKSIHATSFNTKTGIVNLRISLNVGGKKQNVYVSIQGKNNDAINEIKANNDQDSSKKNIEDLFKKSKATIVNQGTTKVSNIASTINDAETLKKAIGIDLSNLALKNSTISSISAVGNTNGVLTVSIKVITKNATHQEFTFTKVFQGKSDTALDMEIANNDQDSSKKIIEDLFKKSKALIINQGTTKVSNIASTINDAETLKNVTGIYLSNLALKNSTISSISAVGNANGVLTVSIKVITKNAAHQEFTFTKVFQGKSDKEVTTEIANNDQDSSKKNIENLFKKSNGFIFNQGTTTVSNIASTINNSETLKNVTGIDLSNLMLNNSIISSISAIGNKNGLLTISIKIITRNAAHQEFIFTKVFKGKSDKALDMEISKEKLKKIQEIANKKQTKNIAKFKNQFNNHKKILRQKTNKVKDIVEEINSGDNIDYKIFFINKWLGTNLDKSIDGTEITKIHAMADPGGRIIISITTYTEKAAQQELMFSKVFQGKSDETIDKEIADKISKVEKEKADKAAKKAEEEKVKEETKKIANKKQVLNIAKFKNQFNNHKKILNQKTETIDMIAGEVNLYHDVERKILVINELFGTNLNKYIDGTEITDIYLNVDPISGKIKISITTYTENATDSKQTFDIYASSKTHFQAIDLNTDKSNIENNKPSGIKKELIIMIGTIAGGLLVLGGIIFFTLNVINKREN